MLTPRRNILVISLVALILASVCLIATISPPAASSEIERNKRALLNLRFPCKPSNVRAYVLWNLQGRHTFNQVYARQQFLVERLVALGYLQQRDFPLEHQGSRSFEHRLEVLIRQNGLLREPLSSWAVSFRPKLKTNSWTQDGPELPTVSVTTRSNDMKIWEQLLLDFDSTNRPPNQHLQETPR